jgi:hypothetical protein
MLSTGGDGSWHGPAPATESREWSATEGLAPQDHWPSFTCVPEEWKFGDWSGLGPLTSPSCLTCS